MKGFNIGSQNAKEIKNIKGDYIAIGAGSPQPSTSERVEWEAIADATNVIKIEAKNEVYICEIVADEETHMLTQKDWENARLIAAAPDMFCALVDALMDVPYKIEGKVNPTWSKIENAIKKAIKS